MSRVNPAGQMLHANACVTTTQRRRRVRLSGIQRGAMIPFGPAAHEEARDPAPKAPGGARGFHKIAVGGKTMLHPGESIR